MTVERYAMIGSAAQPAVRAERRPERILRAPAIAGRIRLRAFIRSSVLLQLVLAMAMIATAALLYLNQAGRVSVLEMSISHHEAEQIELQMVQANLYAQATSLQSLQRVETVATGKLHMAPPAITSVVWVRPTIPSVTQPPAALAQHNAAVRSQPLAWMQQTIRFIGNQL